MPLYDYKCDACGSELKDVLQRFDDDDMTCECGALMSRVPGMFNAHIFPSDGIFLRHVSAKGERFYSKQEMKDYARKHDLQLGVLE